MTSDTVHTQYIYTGFKLGIYSKLVDQNANHSTKEILKL